MGSINGRLGRLESRRRAGAAATEEQRRLRAIDELNKLEAGEIEDPFDIDEVEAELLRRRNMRGGRMHWGGRGGHGA